MFEFVVGLFVQHAPRKKKSCSGFAAGITFCFRKLFAPALVAQ